MLHEHSLFPEGNLLSILNFIQPKSFACGVLQTMSKLLFKQDWNFCVFVNKDCTFLGNTQATSSSVEELRLSDSYEENKTAYRFCCLIKKLLGDMSWKIQSVLRIHYNLFKIVEIVISWLDGERNLHCFCRQWNK